MSNCFFSSKLWHLDPSKLHHNGPRVRTSALMLMPPWPSTKRPGKQAESRDVRVAHAKPTFRAALLAFHKEEATKGKERLGGRRDLVTGTAQCDMPSEGFYICHMKNIKEEFGFVLTERRHVCRMFFSTSDGNSLAKMQAPGSCWGSLQKVCSPCRLCFRNQIVPKNKGDFYLLDPLESLGG